MTIWTTTAVVVWSLVGLAACCFSQELEDFPASALTREQWKLRVEEASRRAEEFVANARIPGQSLPSQKRRKPTGFERSEPSARRHHRDWPRLCCFRRTTRRASAQRLLAGSGPEVLAPVMPSAELVPSNRKAIELARRSRGPSEQ
jgi:hypothetical protein